MSDERPLEALAHLQAAATELITAARIVLDMADGLVSESIRLVGELTVTRGESAPAEVERIEVLGRDEPEPGSETG